MKYLQITLVMGAFFALVIFKNLMGSDEGNRQVGNSLQIQPPTQNNNNASQQATNTNPPAPTGALAGKYKDGSFTGSVEDAFYGNYQVQVVITGGKLADINFLQYPNDNRTSISINSQAMVFLKQEALTAQSANVDIVSGASDSSMAFQKSLATALRQSH